ncbi:MAG: hypothetical protein ISR51_07375 [Rhodospirillales bacterium]|nr:hypothetical protein [Alphaproteobacteria bacterium]MBL6948482.1 hypothetical protein [Rhodospirillales bacterium]
MNVLIPDESPALQSALAGLGLGTKMASQGSVDGTPLEAEILIPGLPDRIREHYADLVTGSLQTMSRDAGLSPPHLNFGIRLSFGRPTEVRVYDSDMVLDEMLRSLIGEFGSVILQNAYMPGANRAEGQRNIFPDLSFHIDRGSNQEEQYSLFCRDPFDEVQKGPRGSSTLIADNMVCYLQKMREAGGVGSPLGTQCYIFKNDDKGIGQIMIEQAWDAPDGVGEICIVDNRTVLHASYYKPSRGYPIGVRYLK